MAIWAVQSRFVGCKKPSQNFMNFAYTNSKKKAEERAEKERKLHPQDEFRVVFVRDKL